MNAPTGKLTGVEEIDISITTFSRLRSEMLDSFAVIEQKLLIYVSSHNNRGFCITAPLGHKIEAAKKVPAGPRRSKELKKKADAELNKLAELLPIRADMVHSRMELAITTSSKFIAIFKNVKDTNVASPEAVVCDAHEFQKFVTSLKKLENSLARALTAQNPPVKTTSQPV